MRSEWFGQIIKKKRMYLVKDAKIKISAVKIKILFHSFDPCRHQLLLDSEEKDFLIYAHSGFLPIHETPLIINRPSIKISSFAFRWISDTPWIEYLCTEKKIVIQFWMFKFGRSYGRINNKPSTAWSSAGLIE